MTIAPKFFKLEDGVQLSDIEGKVCSRAHKVFTKDWPKEIPYDGWVGKCRYRVALYDFPYHAFIRGFPTKIFKSALFATNDFFTGKNAKGELNI